MRCPAEEEKAGRVVEMRASSWSPDWGQTQFCHFDVRHLGGGEGLNKIRDGEDEGEEMY